MRIKFSKLFSVLLVLSLSACNSSTKESNTVAEPTTTVQEAHSSQAKKHEMSHTPMKHTLWKVKGEQNTLYLLGSIHLMPPELYPLPQPYNDAFDDAEKVVFEIDESILNQEAMQKSVLQFAQLPKNQKLEQLVGTESYKEIRNLAKKNNVPMLSIEPFDPWFSSITLIGLQYLNAGLSPEHGIDQHFMRKAQKASKPIIGLETINEQFTMFDSMSMELQTEMLIETLKQEVDMQEFVDEMIEDWQTGDMQGLEDLLMEEFQEEPEMYDAMLVNRNLNWLEQFGPMLKDKDDYLIVVGAAHMLGKDGMVQLLENQGYTVEQL